MIVGFFFSPKMLKKNPKLLNVISRRGVHRTVFIPVSDHGVLTVTVL